jgi:glycosyltransferase involved in cell wall biosynthesis
VESIKKKIIVAVTNDIYTDQRVRRICEFLVANNYDVTLCGRLLKNSKTLPKTDYKTVRFKLPFTKGALFYGVYNLRLFFYLIFHKSDLLLANDLDTLLANHWAKKFKRKCKIIYDSHEYFIGVPELMARPKIQKAWRYIEKKTLPKVHKMYTVNESIADLYRKEYKKEIKVVRNISDIKAVNVSLTKQELGLPEDKRIVIIQGAGINIDRGAEEAIEAIKKVDNCVLIFVGDGDVLPLLKSQVAKEKLEKKVLFFGKRPYQELMNFTAHANIGLSLDKDTNINYRFSLPNKIFDYIHANTPLIVSNLKEVKRIVNDYKIGLVLDNHSPETLANAINQLLDDKELYNQSKNNTKTASKDLNWDNECKVLKEIYL